MRLLVCLAFAAAACSMPALAMDDSDGDEVVCKRSDAPPTGSNMRKRTKVCKKASEWKALERQNDNALRRVNDKMRGGAAPKPAGFGVN